MNPMGPADISYIPLNVQGSEFDEGSVIIFTLDVQNPTNAQLNYNWTLAWPGDAIPFEGNETDSIIFIAPGVEDQSAVIISVEISSSDGSLATPIRELHTITINKRDDIALRNLVTEDHFKSELPEVDQISYENFPAESQWILTSYDADVSQVQAGFLDILFGTSSLLYVGSSAETDQVLYLDCGINVPADFKLLFATPELTVTQCPLQNPVSKYYQANDELRVEHYCDDILVYALNLKQKALDYATNFGQVSVQFEQNDDADVTDGACTTRSLNHLRAQADHEFNITFATLSTSIPYKDGFVDLGWNVLIENGPSGSFELGGNNELNVDENEFFINSQTIVYPEDTIIDTGKLTITDWTTNSVEATFNMILKDSMDQDVDTINGSLKFNF